MPYFFETNKIKLPKNKDRRRKLTDEDIIKIKLLYQKGTTIREITRVINKVTRRAIQRVLFPERNIGRHDWRTYYDKNKHKEYMKSHRKYKNNVLKKDKND
jgi:ATP-dependent Lon protease